MKTRIILALGIGGVTLSGGVAYSAAVPGPRPARPEHSAVAKRASLPPLQIRAHATLIGPYFLPTLEEFSRSWFVTGVIEGDVIDAVTDVRDEQGSVGTTLTMRVDRGWGVIGPMVTTSEYGGVIALRRVRSNFEGKDGQKSLTEADLDRPVEYRMEGFPPTHVGDHVVMFLARKEDGTSALAAKLVRSGASYV